MTRDVSMKKTCTTIRISKERREEINRTGRSIQNIFDLGVDVATHLNSNELDQLFHVMNKRKQKPITHEDMADMKSANPRRQALRKLYKEYDKTQEYSEEKIEIEATKLGIDSEELAKELKDIIWGKSKA